MTTSVENPIISDRHPIRDRESVFVRVVGYCTGCGEEIYEGDDIIEIAGEMIHESRECTFDYCAEIGFAKTAGK
jgi:hypothetical protein